MAACSSLSAARVGARGLGFWFAAVTPASFLSIFDMVLVPLDGNLGMGKGMVGQPAFADKCQSGKKIVSRVMYFKSKTKVLQAQL